VPFFLTATLQPVGELVSDTGYSDFETIDAQLESKTAVDNANNDFVFIVYCLFFCCPNY
jgi:hypothetical protein